MNMTLTSVGKLQMLRYIYSSGLSVEKDIVWLAAKERLVHVCTYAANEWSLLQGVIHSYWKTMKWTRKKNLEDFICSSRAKEKHSMISGGFYFPEAASTTWNSIGYCAKGWVHWPCQKSEQGFHLTVVCLFTILMYI